MRDVVDTTITSPPSCTSPKTYPTSNTLPARWTRTARSSSRPSLDLRRLLDLAMHAVGNAAPSSPKMAGYGRHSHSLTMPDPHSTEPPSAAIKGRPRPATSLAPLLTVSSPPPLLHQNTRRVAAHLCRCQAEEFVLRRCEGRPRPCGRAALLSLSALSFSPLLSPWFAVLHRRRTLTSAPFLAHECRLEHAVAVWVRGNLAARHRRIKLSRDLQLRPKTNPSLRRRFPPSPPSTDPSR